MPRPSNSACKVSRAFFTSTRSGRSSSLNNARISSTLRGRPAASSAPSRMFFSSFFFSGFIGRLLPIHVYFNLVQVHRMGSRRHLHMDLGEGLGLHQLDERLLDELQQREEGDHYAQAPFRGREQAGELAELVVLQTGQ